MAPTPWRDVKGLLKKVAPFKDVWQHRRLVEEQRSLYQLEVARYIDELLARPRYGEPGRLGRREAQVFSQGGEDGVIAEIFRRIGAKDRFFVEIGVGDTLENNTIYPLSLGWSGVWIDGDPNAEAMANRQFAGPLREGRLKIRRALVTAENIAGILAEMKVPPEFDLLSLDIDRNTYWVWAALDKIKPRVAVIEYNPAWPPEADWKVRYDPSLPYNNTAYFGASLKALEDLGRRLGYSLVGCSLAGVNAFFVRADLAGDKFCAPFTAANHYEPSRIFLLHRPGPARCFSDDPPHAA